MASQGREKLATQVNAEILSAVRSLAQSEGRQIQALVDEALADLIEKRKQVRPHHRLFQAVECGFRKGRYWGLSVPAPMLTSGAG